jgi:hypothetical protein
MTVERVLISTKEEELAMGAQGIVVQPGQGQVSSFTPGRSIVLKLLGGGTGGSIMMFEETFLPGKRATSICITTATRWPTS